MLKLKELELAEQTEHLITKRIIMIRRFEGIYLKLKWVALESVTFWAWQEKTEDILSDKEIVQLSKKVFQGLITDRVVHIHVVPERKKAKLKRKLNFLFSEGFREVPHKVFSTEHPKFIAEVRSEDFKTDLLSSRTYGTDQYRFKLVVTHYEPTKIKSIYKLKRRLDSGAHFAKVEMLYKRHLI
ncbi:hypothetical protein [Flammeovirga sp. OC4]|uniref:hypothetical protein n=1 Tax=Flammeovirga sp. OC4 TaxID=1382345 RepID=UPI0005C68CE8|nr:hypothetical protein [Flammeovirga sp. OC4]